MTWFLFSQNNSGGWFVDSPEDGIGECVFIEDASKFGAELKARHLLSNADSCPCCGPRWTYDDPEPFDSFEEDSEYAKSRTAGFIHADGTVSWSDKGQ